MFKRSLWLDLILLTSVLSIYAALYFFNNNYQFFPSWQVPRTAFDQSLTISPYWIWIYLLAYLMPLFMFFYLRRLSLHLHFLQLFFILTIVTNILFFLFPTTIDRIVVPVEGIDSLTKLAFEILFSIDKPFNCFPSTHVSTSFIAALAVRQHLRLFLFFGMIASLISFSAMAIGQHYILDALGGMFAAILAYGIHRIPLKVPLRLKLLK